MKGFWKVYAKCCTVAEPVKEANYVDLMLSADDVFRYWMEENEDEVFDGLDKDDESDMYIAEKRLGDRFNEIVETGIVNCGDYCIMVCDEMPERPNVCGWDAFRG